MHATQTSALNPNRISPALWHLQRLHDGADVDFQHAAPPAGEARRGYCLHQRRQQLLIYLRVISLQ